ncbi:acyl-CoA-binding domain-containing protein 3-like isoform X1 [Asparagus officinalis]|uniref:acyl-CoA-binding domain-containing protein 3-like isoform X1 n=2 Tax=Asparagus officinalis TaxID=4686 RepID=UPI00098E83A7|nr:acyl-CoA-binding domain-containing protein 3-like isoform X1 [Asparagus officinalis]
MKCEEEGEAGVVEVNSAETSADEGSHDEVGIERLDGGLSKGDDVDEVSEVSVPEEASRFLIEEGDGLVERRLDDLLRTKGEALENPAREARGVEERQFVGGAKELQLDLEKEGIKVERSDAIPVRENEPEDRNTERRHESAGDVKERSLPDEEDDWEGIDPTELQRDFREAAAYVGSEGGELALPNLSGDEQMQLYGLHKVATEGPCYDPRPMALKVSARAKWHAWQRLGNMNPDAAMERYMSLLCEKIPGFMRENPKEEEVKKEESGVVRPGLSGACTPNLLCSSIHGQLSPETERRQE